jgi:hypothetical protein
MKTLDRSINNVTIGNFKHNGANEYVAAIYYFLYYSDGPHEPFGVLVVDYDELS